MRISALDVCMGRLPNSLVSVEPVRTVQEGDGGLNLYRINGHQSEFDAPARKLMDKLGQITWHFLGRPGSTL